MPRVEEDEAAPQRRPSLAASVEEEAVAETAEALAARADTRKTRPERAAAGPSQAERLYRLVKAKAVSFFFKPGERPRRWPD